VVPGLHEALVARLRATQRPDGGFPTRPGQRSEPDATALAAIALDDEPARRWVLDHQTGDGLLARRAGPVLNPSPTALAVLALPDSNARSRAADALVAARGKAIKPTRDVPHDPNTRGWGWTVGTFGWVQPTAEAVIALKQAAPGRRAVIADGERLLADRECVGGGWNYGNRVVLGEELPAFVQTTAIALIGLQGTKHTEVAARGRAWLLSNWHRERGGLSLAAASAALRLTGPGADADPVDQALSEQLKRTNLLDDVIAWAWGAIATGPGIETLRVAAR
jgi:hypothetical protein